MSCIWMKNQAHVHPCIYREILSFYQGRDQVNVIPLRMKVKDFVIVNILTGEGPALRLTGCPGGGVRGRSSPTIPSHLGQWECDRDCRGVGMQDSNLRAFSTEPRNNMDAWLLARRC